MTDKQQPEALRLAHLFDNPLPPEWPDMVAAAAELRRLHADNEHKDKYAEQLGRELAAADAETRTLRTGYAAARLEIESLRGRSPIPPNSREYPALPEPDTRWRAQFAGHGVSFHSEDQIIGFANERASAAVDAARAMRAAQPAGAQQPAIMPKGDSTVVQLRAMATNYPVGHLWDKLDAKACIRGALEIEALRASHGQAPAGATLPEGWVPLVIMHEGQYPEEVAYGPQRMMDRLDKWLRKYFDFVAAAKEQPAPAADLQEDQTQPWYDLAWKHGARRHASFDGDELTELSFRPAQFDAFCAELAPAAGAVAPAAVAGPSDWRELAAKVMDALADAQEQTNAAYPAHVSCYPGWEAQARWLRWHADMFRTGKPAGNGAGHPAVLAALAAAPTTQPAPQQEASPTAGMTIAQRILHVGGRNNAAGYVEFGSIQAVEALVRQVLRDLKPSPASQGDALDTVRLDWMGADEGGRVFHLGKSWYTRSSYGMPCRKQASLREAIDAARAAQKGGE